MDSVLLKIHRQYSKEEAIKCLFSEISRLKFTIGELQSENAELIHQNNLIKGVRQWSKDEYIQELKSTIKNKIKAKGKAEKEAIEWRNKYFDILARSQISH